MVIASSAASDVSIGELLDGFSKTSTTIISDCMDRLPGTGLLRPFHRLEGPMVGIARTVRTAEGDNMAIHQALIGARPHDVIVVDGAGMMTRALIGDIMVAMAAAKRCAGYVIDGAVRDGAVLAQQSLPVFARGFSHRGPFKNGPGQLDIPVAVAGMVVNPGDIIVGDYDGLVAFPAAEAPALLKACLEREAFEAGVLANIRLGESAAY